MQDRDPTRQEQVTDPSQSRLEREYSNRPSGYPNVFAGFRAGMLRNWRGIAGAFFAAWFYVPLALLCAVVGAVLGGLAGFFAGVAGLEIPPELLDLPLIGEVAEAILTGSGGIASGIAGAGVGFIAGLLVVLYLPWIRTESWTSLLAGLAGALAAALLIGVLYTLCRVLLEPRLLAASGARRLSRREAEKLIPVLHDCARRLGLRSVPRLLVEDDLTLTNARAYSRHIVVTTRLLTDPPDEIRALLSHELVHWRSGDEVNSAIIRGVGLPLLLVHAVPAWLMRTFPHPATNFLVYLIFWPVLLTMKYLVLPLNAWDVRKAEYRADAGAVAAGYAEGLRAILEKRKPFERGRSGWDEAVYAVHPAYELRLERLEAVAPPTPAADQSATAPAQPVSAKALSVPPVTIGSRRAWIAVGVVLLVLCLAAGVLGALQWAVFQPQAAVDRYFTALSGHDSAAALDRLDAASKTTAAEKKLLAEILNSPDYQPPSKVDVKTVTESDKTAFGVVSFTLDGDRYTSRLKLKRNEAATLGVFHGWSLENGLGSFTIAGGQGDVLVNGVKVPTKEDYRLVTLPGVYTVTAPENLLSETTSEKVVVLPGTDQGVITLTATLRSTVQEHVDQEIKKYLDRCAEQQVGNPTGCPFGYDDSSWIGSIKWKVIEYPKVEISLITPSSAVISTSEEDGGTIRATGRTTEDYFSSEPFEDEVCVYVSGTISAAGDALSLALGN
ncbi:MAG TPA: M48 family metalloprotease [Micromonosporaceae bacterium]|nr:M48 family metalloprotease [Micromonosporaceae bacterium]